MKEEANGSLLRLATGIVGGAATADPAAAAAAWAQEDGAPSD